MKLFILIVIFQLVVSVTEPAMASSFFSNRNGADSIEQILNQCVTPQMSARDKARAIHFWISRNIRYDASQLFADNIHISNENNISKTLQTHKGICLDYANLVEAFCNKLRIECHTVTGYTRQKTGLPKWLTLGILPNRTAHTCVLTPLGTQNISTIPYRLSLKPLSNT